MGDNKKMKFLIRVYGTKGNLVDAIVHMQRIKTNDLKDLYDLCSKVHYELSVEDGYRITTFDIIEYNKNDEYISRITFNDFNQYMAKNNKYPKFLREIKL